MQLRHVSTNLRQSLRRNVSMHAAVILTLFVSLSLAGVGVLLSQQASLTTQVIGSELQISVYLCVPDDPRCTGEVTPDEEAAILDAIRANPQVAGEPRTISKEEGLQNYVERGLVTEEQTTGPDALLTKEFVPKEIRITLVDPEEFDGVVSAVEDLDGVRDIVLAKDLVEPVFLILDYVRYAAWGAAGVLVLAAVMLVANTIRLTALARRKEIEIMRLVGASRIFIALPFLLEALVTALLGVALAAGALAALMEYGIIRGLDATFDFLPFVGWSDYLFTVGVIAVIGPLLTVVPTLLLTRKYLRF